jgi:hypothetical protein
VVLLRSVFLLFSELPVAPNVVITQNLELCTPNSELRTPSQEKRSFFEFGFIVWAFILLLYPQTLPTMTSNVNTKTTMPSSKPSASPTKGVAHSPSVPISVYREIASELQSTRTSLDSLKVQNTDLVYRNQQLRLEIERVVQSALYLRQLADVNLQSGISESEDLVNPAIAEIPSLEVALDQSTSFNAPPTPSAKNPLKQVAGLTGKLFTEQSSQPHGVKQSEPKEIGAWWLVLVICMIVVTAFGTGFLIVRPLLPSR